jgi:arginyl-tRNA synthetase
MVNYKQKIAEIIMTALDGLTFDEVLEMVEIPTDNKMGDYAFPCFKLAKTMRKAPPVIAKEVVEKIQGLQRLKTSAHM